MNTVKQKNPVVAGILGLLFGPIGYLYLGFNLFLASFVISIIIQVVLYFLNLPYPPFFNYIQLLIWGYFGYKFAEMNNVFRLTDSEELKTFGVKEYKSISFAFLTVIPLMMRIVQYYAFLVGIVYLIMAYSQGKILLALLILFFGIGLIQYVLNFIFSLISLGIIKIFKIDKKFF